MPGLISRPAVQASAPHLVIPLDPTRPIGTLAQPAPVQPRAEKETVTMSIESFFAGIPKAAHTFGAWFEKEWAKLYKDAPAIEKVADATLTYAGPALDLVLADVDPAAAAVVAPIIAEAQKDLSVANGLIYDFGATPNAASILTTVENNLGSILAAGHIKNSATVAKLTGIINGIGSLAAAILKSIASANGGNAADIGSIGSQPVAQGAD
jgi:hypothetical protein